MTATDKPEDAKAKTDAKAAPTETKRVDFEDGSKGTVQADDDAKTAAEDAIDPRKGPNNETAGYDPIIPTQEELDAAAIDPKDAK